jgi:hypothetical protein
MEVIETMPVTVAPFAGGCHGRERSGAVWDRHAFNPLTIRSTSFGVNSSGFFFIAA